MTERAFAHIPEPCASFEKRRKSIRIFRHENGCLFPRDLAESGHVHDLVKQHKPNHQMIRHT